MKKKRKKLFIKTLCITLASVGSMLVLTIILYKSIVRPPEILGNDDPISHLVDNGEPDLNDYAYLPPDGEEEDMLIGDGTHTPESHTVNDRKEEFYTFLIVGLDGGINTDTIMVASYDGINKEASIISIPRDSMINVKRDVKKINAAYPAGTLHGGGREGGIDQLKREVKTIIGFVPDFYICIDLNAFVKIVDALEGVKVNVPINMVYDDPTQNLHINIKKGEQTLNGADALKFARYRNGNTHSSTISDYARIENQQTVIKAVLTKLLNPINILKIPEFIGIFSDNVYSDIKPENMLWFADQLNRIRGTDALSTYTMPTNGGSGPNMYYEYLDEAAIVELVNKTINPFTKEILDSDLDIINGE